jgi:hypothetical protein
MWAEEELLTVPTAGCVNVRLAWLAVLLLVTLGGVSAEGAVAAARRVAGTRTL